jgi:hypothetical protein
MPKIFCATVDSGSRSVKFISPNHVLYKYINK